MKRENSDGIAAAKDMLRHHMRAKLRAMPADVDARASLEICRMIAKQAAFREVRTVALFAPLPTEPDIQRLIEEAWDRQQRVVFPLVLSDRPAPALEWREVASWEQMTVPGPFGISQPNPRHCPLVDPQEIECILVPGLAFDAEGGRLGRGGGYYDSALRALKAGTPRIGVMFAVQQVQDLPRNEHDETLQLVVTETGVFSTGSRAKWAP